MSESATFDSMIELIMAGNYDYYIFDMMPHGHAIRFLSMASMLDVWIIKCRTSGKTHRMWMNGLRGYLENNMKTIWRREYLRIAGHKR